MARPPLSDWETVFGFSEDPAPGEPDILEQLASEYRSVSREAGDAQSVVSRLDSHDLGEGKSMEELRKKLAELPKQVGKLHTSYEAAAEAITNYAAKLREAQEQADRALEQGRDAKDRLESVTAVAFAAGAHVKSLDDPETLPPDDKEARRSAGKALADAKEAESRAAESVDSAQAELDAARMLAEDAYELRTSDAGQAKRSMDEAKDDAVEGKSIWEKFRDILSMVFSIVGAVLGVVAMFFTGPAGLILAGLSLAFGAASLGITIRKGVETGTFDVVGIVLGVLGLAAGGISFIKGAVGTLKGVTGGKAGVGGWGKAQWQKGTNWAKGHWGKGSGPKPLPESIPMNNLRPVHLIPRKPVPKSGNPFLDKPLPPPPPPTRPPPLPPTANINKPLPSPFSPVDMGLDLAGTGLAVGGIIYSPISFDGKGHSITAEGDFPKIPWDAV